MTTSTTTTTRVELKAHDYPPSEHITITSTADQEESQAQDTAAEARLTDSSVPDDGYGWVIVLGCAILTFLFYGTTSSWGIFQAALVETQLASTTTLSFVGSVQIACTAILALAGARVFRLLGARRTGMAGILILGVGEMLASLTTNNIGGFFMTAGFIMGIGTCLCFMVTSVTPSQYFNTKLGLAQGLIKAGGGLGGTALSFGLNKLIEELSPAWTLRILGFVTLATGLPAAWLVQERYPSRSANFIEWRLFKDFSFTMVFLAGAVAVFALFVPAFFLPLYARSLGLSSSTGAALLAGFNFSTAVGRLGAGYMCDGIGPVNTFLICMLLNAVTMLSIWPVSDSLAPLMVFAIINGVANGGFFTTMPTVISKLFGSAKVSVATGMIITGWSGGYFAGAPIAGALLQAYGGKDPNEWAYRPAIFYAGSVALAASGFVLLVRLKQDTKILKKL